MGTSRYDVVVTNARLRDQPVGVWNVGITDATITAVSREALEAKREIDADGQLVSVPFANAHLHLCKVYTLPMVGEEALRRYSAAQMGEAMAAIGLAAQVKDQYKEGWIYDNARRALLDGLRHGVTHVRAFADTDTRAELEAIKALLRLRAEFAGVIDIQVVAFPQDGILRDQGAAELVTEALALGADVVGGIPWIELTDRDAAEHVRIAMELATRFDRDVAMLVDDAGDPGLRTAEMLANAAMTAGWTGRIAACHARAMVLYPPPYLHRLITLAHRVGMSFVSNPHTGPLCLPIAEVLGAGVPVALGQDDIDDAYYPYGQHNLLEVAFLASHVLHRYTLADMEMFFDMITRYPATVMRLPDHRIAPGNPADLVVLDGASVHEVLTRHKPPRWVLRGGRVVAESQDTTRFADDLGV